jgi:hypothetical protein
MLRPSPNSCHIAPATVEQTRGATHRKGPGAKQIKYESATRSDGLGFANKASRIFPIDPAARNAVTKSSGCRDSLVPQTGTGRPSVGQTMKESDMVESPRVALQRQAAIAAVGRSHQVLVNEQLQAPPIIEQALPHASNGDLRTVRRTNREGIGHGGIAACRPSKGSRDRRRRTAIKSWLTARKSCRSGDVYRRSPRAAASGGLGSVQKAGS